MKVRFEWPTGDLIEVSDQVINPAALPRVIAAPEGSYWFSGQSYDGAHLLPVYRLAREVSGATH